MSKSLLESVYVTLPSKARVHPCRLIIRDGTLMWRNALGSYCPADLAHEQHIIKTATRLEELNRWTSSDPDDQTFEIHKWFDPTCCGYGEGISVLFTHPNYFDNDELFATLESHIYPHEVLAKKESHLFFKRC